MSVHVIMAELADVMRANGIPDEQIWELGPEFDHAGNGNDWKSNEQPVAGVGQSVKGYWWTDVDGTHQRFDGSPNGHYLHHTAGSRYVPYVKNWKGQTKANAYAGLRRGNVLYQDGGGIPTISLASAGPADYSAGANNDELIKDFFANNIRFIGRQTKPDTPGFYGNRYVWNTEVVLNGIGAILDPDLRDLLIVYCGSISQLLGKSAWIHGGHGQGSKRKIDLRDGRYPDMAMTIFTMQTDTLLWMVDKAMPPVEPPPIEPPPERPPVEDQKRNQLYIKEGMSGQDVEYWQVMSIMAHDNIPFTGNSNRTFINNHAPQLIWKEWDEKIVDPDTDAVLSPSIMTTYVSEFTGRNSYGIGATERIMIETAVIGIYAAL